jgi:hypothetical protein
MKASVSKSDKNIKDIYDCYRSAHSIVIPDLQRKYIWTPKQQGLLIDSILRGYDIPKIYAFLSGETYEIADGHQRVETVCRFKENKFKTPKDMLPIDGKDLSDSYFKDLPEEYQQKFNLTEFDIRILSNYSEADKEEAFLRLQAGTPLSPAEKRHAIMGELRDIICHIAQTHEIFGKDSSKFKMDRYQDEEVVAKCIYLFLHGKLCTLDASVLHKMYESHRKFSSSHSTVKRLKWALNFLNESIGVKESFSGFTKNALISLVFLVDELRNEYCIEDCQEDFAIAFLEFEDIRIKNNNLPDEEKNVDFERYNRSIREQSYDHLVRRHNFLKKFFVDSLKLKTKDPKRSFNGEDLDFIFRRDNGICGVCGRKVERKDAVIDHIVPHVKGGRTVLDNGQLAHIKCNQSKSDKYLNPLELDEESSDEQDQYETEEQEEQSFLLEPKKLGSMSVDILR